MATELETLVVTLEASVRQYERQLAKAQGTTVSVMRNLAREVDTGGKRISTQFGVVGMQAGRKFQEGMKRSLTGLGRGLVGGIIGGLGLDALRQAIASIGDIGDTARDLGVSTDALQTFWKAMQMGGGKAESMTKAIANVQSELEDTGSVLSDFLRRNNWDPANHSIEETFNQILKLSQAMPSEERLKLFTEGLKLRPAVALQLAEAATHIEDAGKAAKVSAQDIAKLDKLNEDMTDGFQRAGVMVANFLGEVSDTDSAEGAINGLVTVFGELLGIIKEGIDLVKELHKELVDSGFDQFLREYGPFGRKVSPVTPVDLEAKRAQLERNIAGARQTGIGLPLVPGWEEDLKKINEQIAEAGKELGKKAKDAIDPEETGRRMGKAAADALSNADLGLGLQTGAGEAAGFVGAMPSADQMNVMGNIMNRLAPMYGKTISAAIVGNLMRESGLNPRAPGSAGEIGIAQWRLDRRSQLQAFAASRGTSETDLVTQIHFLLQELQGERGQKAIAAMQGKSLPEATEAFMRIFEAPKAGPGAGLGQRIGFAQIASEGGKGLADTPADVHYAKTAKQLAEEAKSAQAALDVLQKLNQQRINQIDAVNKKIALDKMQRELDVATAAHDNEAIARIKARITAVGEGIDITDKATAAEKGLVSALTQSEAANLAAADAAQRNAEAQKQLEEFGGALEGAVTNFVDALVEGKSASDALRGALKSLASDLLHMAIHNIFQSLFSPPAAGGASPVASLLGFQHGGQFRVGGAGGTDSSLVAFRATPGEEVTVTPRRLAGTRGSGGISMGGTIINIEGSADERTVEMMDRRIAANNHRQRKALERDWGSMSARYQQLRG